MKYLIILFLILFSFSICKANLSYFIKHTQEDLYCPYEPELPNENHKYIMIYTVLVRDFDSLSLYDGMPVMYPAYYEYHIIYLDSLEIPIEHKDKNIITVIEIGQVYNIEKQYKETQKTETIKEFDKFIINKQGDK